RNGSLQRSTAAVINPLFGHGTFGPCARQPKRTEALASVNPPLDGAVVLLEHVVQIWHRPMAAILGESAFGFELRDGDWIRGVAVGVDHSRRGMVRSAQRFSEKALGPRPRPAW